MQYYLVYPKSEYEMILRGNPDDFLSFEKYDAKLGIWERSDSFFWADKILVSDFVDFQEITKTQAEGLIDTDK